MVSLIAVGLVVIALAIIGFIISIVQYMLQKEDDETDEDYNKQMNIMCEKARNANVCPGKCEICAWALHKEGGKIYRFSGRNEKH